MADANDTLWQPSATQAEMTYRAELLARIRHFFSLHSVLEVDTPALSSATTVEPHLHAFALRSAALKKQAPLYLHTSPEFPMKRLLAAGSGPIYQICKVFRDDERGRYHNPEFTMLEWYRPGFDHFQLMDEVEALLRVVAQDAELTAIRLTYRQAFLDLAGIDPFAALADLQRYVEAEGIEHSGDTPVESIDYWRDLILVHRVEPGLNRHHPTFLYDYPASQASLARIRQDGIPVAERFELYWGGLELANGFHELCDAEEQAARFVRDQSTREHLGLAPVREDRRLLGALQAGLPPCAGVALGIDRLLMVLSGAQHIDEVLAFPFDRA